LGETDNLERIGNAVATAAQHGAALVVFPELANIGQVSGRDREFGARYAMAADTVPGSFTSRLGEMAEAHGCLLVVGMAERHRRISGTLFNSAVVVGADGEVLAVQRKLHPSGEERFFFAPGDEIITVDTDLGRMGVGICYDVFFPEVPRAMALQGAELLCGVFNLTARHDIAERLTHFAAVRAYENMVNVVFVNRVGENHGRRFGGGSVAAAPPGRLLIVGPRDEEVVLDAALDRADVLRERAFRPVFADRRPHVYALDSERRRP
jgi:predicted amidohydrolase